MIQYTDERGRSVPPDRSVTTRAGRIDHVTSISGNIGVNGYNRGVIMAMCGASSFIQKQKR